MDTDTVKKVAHLSRIAVSEEELAPRAEQLNNIIGFIEQLSEVNTDNVEPLANVVDTAQNIRKDVINDGDCQEAVLANAPEETQNFFSVPKVVE